MAHPDRARTCSLWHMRVFVTGGTGFIGGHVVEKLRASGDDVVALVRSPSRARALTKLDCELVEGDLSDKPRLTDAMKGCDGVVHLAAVYRVGIPVSERPAMHHANVTGTENVLDAAIEARVGKIVYVSTIGAFGNTRGDVVDESFDRTDLDYLSAYDETKYLAHRTAQDRIENGAPIVIAQPGGVYGPGDASDLGNLFDQIRKGRMKALVFPDVGFNFAHVEDIAEGIVLVLDKGRIGESYILGGELSTIGELIKKISLLSGRKPPKMEIPAGFLKAIAPLGPLIGKPLGLGPNFRELVKAAEGVTYYATDAKARRELGYRSRSLDEGLGQTVAAGG